MSTAASLQEWRASGHRTRVGAFELSVHKGGNGPALLCIHGFPTSSWDFRHLWPALTEHFSVVAIDLLGFGDSNKPPGHRYRIVEQAELQLAVLAQFGIDQFDVLAHDYGVSVAQELLARQLDGSGAKGLRSVCFLNGGLLPELHRPLLVQRLLSSPVGPLLALFLGKSAFERSLRRVFGANTPPSREELDGYWDLFTRAHGRRALPQLIRYMGERREQRTRWVSALTKTRLPLGFICGALDPIAGRHLAEHLQTHFPAIDVRLLEHIGHYPQVEDPPAVLAEYLSFRQGKSKAV